MKTHLAYPGEEWSWRHFSGLLQQLRFVGPSTNVGALVGHGSIRIAAVGFQEKRPSADELNQMQQFIFEAMQQGALGMSSGLAYAPSCFADVEELAAFDGVYASHLRNEGRMLQDSVGSTRDRAPVRS
ncbi:MAG TPA: hypothetical protein GXX40_01245 [Firmicutes bacterium]|nr:hypothetical protein [Bacillota bacterium]